MSDDIALLQQRVSSQQEKFDQATAVVDLAQARFDTSSATYEDAASPARKRAAKKVMPTAKAPTKRAVATGRAAASRPSTPKRTAP